MGTLKRKKMRLLNKLRSNKSAEQVTHFCRVANERIDPCDAAVSSPNSPMVLPSSGGTLTAAVPLTDAQRLRKVILELINTERNYVRDLCMLMERYLEPLRDERFLPSDEVVRLVGNIQEIVYFQKEFLTNLEEAADDESMLIFTCVSEFKKVLFSIAGSFIYFANHFKLYSSFCASHSRAQKVLSPGDNSELFEFLHARNPKQQHSATLESYLIKPIQRILKYPLLLQQLRALTDAESTEFTHLSEALRAMESVAAHINEMQKIYEEFGAVFDDLSRSHTSGGGGGKEGGTEKRALELNLGDMQYYGESEWLNATDDIAKARKGWEHHTTIFVFKHGVVLLCQQKIKGKSSKYKGAGGKGSTIDTGLEFMYSKFLPVTEIQVRSIPTAHARGPVALWELLHLKSASESRPEKIYHMACSTVDSRSDFLKHIRQTIRDSVRKMTIPKTRHIEKEPNKHRHSVNTDTSLSNYHDTEPISTTNHLTSAKQDNRYSMNIDVEKLSIPDLHNHRSRTYGDLAFNDKLLESRNMSRNSVSSDVSLGSQGARLVYSSQDPLSYHSSKSSLDCNDSPVWQKRSDSSSESIETGCGPITEDKRSLKIHGVYIDTATEC